MYSIHSFHYKISPWVSQIQNRLKIHCRTEKIYIKLINKHLIYSVYSIQCILGVVIEIQPHPNVTYPTNRSAS